LRFISVPGRVNLIGEHIDYHNLPVLPIAIQRRIRIAFRQRTDRRIHASSRQFGQREFEWTSRLEPSAAGDWENYVKAAAQAIAGKWGPRYGIDAEVESDLPAAAGLSSSSALLTGFTLALLRANGIEPRFEELMDILPEGEHFVGTRGGGMDHAAVLAAEPGSALLIRFDPVEVESVPAPRDWAFLAAHSLVTAEKSGAVREEYNSRRVAGNRALEKVGWGSYKKCFSGTDVPRKLKLAPPELDAFMHVTGEGRRVLEAVEALRAGDAEQFGAALNASHDSLRDLLRVSCKELDELVEIAREAGAFGARLTGAGFGGFAVIACRRDDRERIASELVRRFYANKPEFDADKHLIAVEPSAGALHV
jgi:galactokinase